MGLGEILRMGRMRVDPALTQALRSRWDTEATAFAFPWVHMIPSLEDVSWITGLRVYGRPVSGYTYPCYHELAEQLLDLPVERRSSLVPRVALQESLGLYEADLDLRRFLVLLLEDLGEVGGYAWGAAFLVHQFDGLSASERQTSTSGFYPFLQVWVYLHLPALGRGDLTQPGWPLHAVGTPAETPATLLISWSACRRPLTATLTWMWFGSHTWGRVMRDSLG
ncbi:hypothetical protein Taro_054659 [Colocasia esculenta]|uniref:Aminotransferase-like plant mobile domain-containing protein n=1 Tax=Colocasia esculenta TaxID=4460 RepID=A0A843XQP7_COLES|nr:hypothetical protein [Colocasia esculenta]